MPQNLRDQLGILSAGENEGTVWPQAKKCASEAVARAGENEGTVWPQAKKCASEAVARAGDDPELAAAIRAGLDVDKVN